MNMESFTCSKQSYCHSLSIIIIIVLALLCNSWASKIEAKLDSNSSNGDFIKNSCGVTRFPDLCYQTLSPYASSIQDNQTQLANTALNVTLESAESTSLLVVKMFKARNLRPVEVGAMRDCVETMKDSVDELQQCLMMIRDLEGPDFQMKMSNIQTWLSAALTDEDTCMDGFQENSMNGKVKDNIRSHVGRVAQLTSNALALINKLIN